MTTATKPSPAFMAATVTSALAALTGAAHLRASTAQRTLALLVRLGDEGAADADPRDEEEHATLFARLSPLGAAEEDAYATLLHVVAQARAWRGGDREAARKAAVAYYEALQRECHVVYVQTGDEDPDAIEEATVASVEAARDVLEAVLA